MLFWKKAGQTQDEQFLAATELKPGRPVDDLQATLLARAYFTKYLGDCGFPERPISRGNDWLFKTLVGLGASPGAEIRVQKGTRITSAKGLPTVRDARTYVGPIRKRG
jgi:hypothetical protein